MSETFFNPNLQNTDADTVTTMGGLEGLPAFNLGNFLGTAEQLAQLFPGGQEQPKYTPGLTDLTYTRSFKPGGSDTGIYWSPIPSTARPQDQGAAPGSGYYVPNIPLPEDETSPQQASLLSGLLGSLFAAAGSPQAEAERLARLKAAAQDINISNVFTPTNVNYQTQSQQQKQWMGGQGQGQEQDSSTDSDSQDYGLDDLLERVVGTSITPRVSVRTSTIYGTSITPYTSLVSRTTTSSGSRDIDTDTTVSDLELFDNTSKYDTVNGGNVDDFINLDDIFEGTDTQQGGNTTDTIDGGLTNLDTLKGGNANDSIVDTSKGTSKTDTLKGGNGLDDIDLGTWENQQTIDGGNGNDSIVKVDETPSERAARLAAEQAERDRQAREQAERDRVAREQAAQAERDRLAREAIVKQAYQQQFGRSDIDQEGLDYWSGQLASGKSSTDLLRDLVSGAQGADVQAAQNTDTVSKLYQDLLGHAPDPEGLSYYRQQLAAGATPNDVARNIISGAQGTDVGQISEAERAQYFPPARTQPSADTGEVRNTVEDLYNFAKFQVEGRPDIYAEDPDALRTALVQRLVNENPDYYANLTGTRGLTDAEGNVDYNSIYNAVKDQFGSDAYTTMAPDLFENISRKAAETGVNLAIDKAGQVAIDFLAEAFASEAIPVVGQVIGIAMMIDSIASNIFNYDSPIQDAVSWIVDATMKGFDALGGVIGDAWDSVQDFFSGIGDWFNWAQGGLVRYADGGLVDMPYDSLYNDGGQVDTFAMGGLVPLMGGGKIVKGPGGGLDDLIPTTIDGKRAAALSDGEFVIPADVVSMMGDGSSTAGAKRLYDLVKGVRQHKTGTSRQAGPLPVGKILERTMR